LLKVLFSFGPKAAWLRLLYSTIPFSGKGPYDIIQCHFGPNARLPVSLRERGALHGKIVTTFHGYDVSVLPKAKGNGRIYAELFAKGDLFLAVSERIRNKLISLGCPPSKTLVHRCGVDTGKFDLVPRNLRGGKDQRVRLLTIARLVEKKGVRYAIDAAARIIQRHPEVIRAYLGSDETLAHA
jgi:colanic acid/amylovoran biosynthesis glycosyltransferase